MVLTPVRLHRENISKWWYDVGILITASATRSSPAAREGCVSAPPGPNFNVAMGLGRENLSKHYDDYSIGDTKKPRLVFIVLIV